MTTLPISLDTDIPQWLPPPDRPPPRDFLARLVAGGAIARFQADWIAAIWPRVDEDAFGHPCLRTVPEHTRAYLERRDL